MPPQKQGRSRRSHKPSFEAMEGRLLLSATVTVQGTADPYLADPNIHQGQPTDSDGNDISTATDGTAPPFVAVTGGSTLTFNVSGQTQYFRKTDYPDYPLVTSPDGADPYPAIHGSIKDSEISSWYLPLSALGGVFLKDTKLSQAPSPWGGSQTDATISPDLGQVFFIGDGLTGTGSGARQTFKVPVGATRLYLFNIDGEGWFDNSGSYSVTVSSHSEPNIALMSATVYGSIINYTYAIQGDPGSLVVGLYQSAVPTFNNTASLVATQNVKYFPNSSGSGSFTLNYSPSPSRPYFFVVANPGHLPIETNFSDNVVNVVRNLAWGAKVSPLFRSKVVIIANQMGVDPSYIMAAMAFETGRSFSPSVRNAAGSGAVGLIQFMPTTATALGTTTTALASMTAEQQLDYVFKYFVPYFHRLHTISDVYLAILYPIAVGQPPGQVLFDKTATPKKYVQNQGFDTNHDGKITVAEATQPVAAQYQLGLQFGNVFVMKSFYA